LTETLPLIWSKTVPDTQMPPPSAKASRAVLGLGTVSAEPQKKVEVPRQDHREGSDLYNKLMTRVSPLLCRGIDDLLLRWKKRLTSGGVLEVAVSAPINGFYRTVGATSPPEAPFRQNSSKLGEGARGFLAERKLAGYVPSSRWAKEGKRQVFDRHGQVLAEFPVVRTAGLLGYSPEVKWHYYRPIFEKSTANPWSNRVVGVFVVYASADDADSLFRTAEFQQQVDSIASEVSPYLDAIQVLVGEEKL